MQPWRRIQFTEFISKQGMGASPISAFANDASTSERIIDIDWEDQTDAIEDILGYPTVKNTGITGGPNSQGPYAYISRVTPMPDPRYLNEQGNFFLYCSKISRLQGYTFTDFVQGDGATFPAIAAYHKARLTLQFESFLYDIREDKDPLVQSSYPGGGPFPDEALLNRYVTRTGGLNADYFTMQSGIMKYCPDSNASGSVVPFNVGKIIGSANMVLTWELVPWQAIPSRLIDPTLTPVDTTGALPHDGQAYLEFAIGKVNAEPFAGYEAGKVLFLGAGLTPIRAATGRRLWRVQYMFKVFEPGHHKVYSFKDAATGGFVEVSVDGTLYAITPTTPDGKHAYDVAFMKRLFWPPRVVTP